MEQTVKGVLANIARELGGLADLTTTLQAQLSPSGRSDIDVVAFQRLDSLTQILSSLAAFMTEIQSSASCECGIAAGEALDNVCLSDLAMRLRGGAEASNVTESGSCEFF